MPAWLPGGQAQMSAHAALRPLLAADQPQEPAELRSALRTIDHQIEDYIIMPGSVRPRET
jgi:hypothetical protein